MWRVRAVAVEDAPPAHAAAATDVGVAKTRLELPLTANTVVIVAPAALTLDVGASGSLASPMSTSNGTSRHDSASRPPPKKTTPAKSPAALKSPNSLLTPFKGPSDPAAFCTPNPTSASAASATSAASAASAASATSATSAWVPGEGPPITARAVKFGKKEEEALVEDLACTEPTSGGRRAGIDYMRARLDAAVRADSSIKPSAEFYAVPRLIRFLRANSWDLNEAWAAYWEALEFRRERKLDQVRDSIVAANADFFIHGGPALSQIHLHPDALASEALQPRLFCCSTGFCSTGVGGAVTPGAASPPITPPSTNTAASTPYATPSASTPCAFTPYETPRGATPGGATPGGATPGGATPGDGTCVDASSPGHVPLLDRRGNLSVFECPGAADYAGIVKLGAERWGEAYLWHMELRVLMIDELSRRTGRLALVTTVLDMSLFKTSLVMGGASRTEQEGFKTWKSLGKLVSLGYPGQTHRQFFCNSPGGWVISSLFTALAPARSKKKLVFIANKRDVPKTLLIHIKPESLPRRLGGQLPDGDLFRQINERRSPRDERRMSRASARSP